jgi:ATP-dependent RNA helicase DDX47/RRP3
MSDSIEKLIERAKE